jgi:hypothetical protein
VLSVGERDCEARARCASPVDGDEQIYGVAVPLIDAVAQLDPPRSAVALRRLDLRAEDLVPRVDEVEVDARGVDDGHGDPVPALKGARDYELFGRRAAKAAHVCVTFRARSVASCSARRIRSEMSPGA